MLLLSGVKTKYNGKVKKGQKYAIHIRCDDRYRHCYLCACNLYKCKAIVPKIYEAALAVIRTGVA